MKKGSTLSIEARRKIKQALQIRGERICTAERFWSLVSRSDECWEWQGGRQGKGYGMVNFQNKRWLTHRLSWFLIYGPIPLGLKVCHTCDNPPCCRPDHLFLGTNLDNTQDAISKGRFKNPPLHIGEDCHTAKLHPIQVVEIRARYLTGETQVALAREFHVTQANISRIIKRLSWKHIQ